VNSDPENADIWSLDARTGGRVEQPRPIRRWTRPVCWQDAPAASLPLELQDDNLLGVHRRINGKGGHQ
jgi:hypothetical protein